MYVCICKSVTETAIHNEVENGANSLRDLASSLCVATQCGKCKSSARSCLTNAQQKISERTAFSSAA